MAHTPSIYLDHAATTPVDPRVVEAMLPYWTETYGNPSSIHRYGQAASAALEAARRDVADILGCAPGEIVFTSCGSESDNLALRGAAFAARAAGKGNHVLISPVEHHAVSHTAAQLRDSFGFNVTILPVDEYGQVNPDDVGRAIRDDTVLISVMYANNEIGTIQPIAEIGALARRKGIAFHTDAVQAGGMLDLNVDKLNVDLLALSAHKFYGPKGVGVLYVRKGTPLLPMQTGGGHEHGLRAGTQNVPYIVGLATALRLAQSEKEAANRRFQSLRDRLIGGVLQAIPDARLTGHPSQRLPNNASFAIRGVTGQDLLVHLDIAGVAASSGSACTVGDPEPSEVLIATGLPREWALGSLRLTVGRQTTDEHVDYTLDVLPRIVARLRAL